MEYIIDEIEEIIDLGEQSIEMYDIGMRDTPHTFFANNILVHNSIFFNAGLLLKYKGIDLLDNDKACIKETLNIANELQEFINKSYDNFAFKVCNVTKHKFQIKQENIAKTGFWTDVKKRYIQLMIYKEGKSVNELDVKGIEIVRSNFPIAFRKFLKELLHKVLAFESKQDIDSFIIRFKKQLINRDYLSCMFPSSIKNIDKYNTNREQFTVIKGTPIHVRSALYYNDMIDYFQIPSSEGTHIRNMDKIKFIHLKNNPLNIDVMALKGYNDPQKINEFINSYGDVIKNFDTAFDNKIINYYTSLDWTPVIENQNVNNFFNF